MDARQRRRPNMPVTLTIKQVPERIAERLRARAAASHRSLQGELMAVLEASLATPASLQQPQAAYRSSRPKRAQNAEAPLHERRLTLAELWEIGRKTGLKSRSESARIIRRMRDERNGS